MAQQHRIANLCDGSTERSVGLHEIYEDNDGSMREEVRESAGRNVARTLVLGLRQP